MNTQPNRLPAEGDHRFKGSEIDRQRPLRFRLDGHLIHGFAGDTVLSAALASGLIAAGTRGGEPLALDERFAPLVRLARRRRGTAAEAWPMARTPAIDGLDLATIGIGTSGRLARAWTRLKGELRQNASGLKHAYDAAASPSPWLNMAPSERVAADIVVIGGGIAGMSAALEAAKRSERVVLIERRPSLGGNAGFFGATGDEEAPEATIERLRRGIDDTPGITVLCRAEAFGLSAKMALLHQIVVEAGAPAGRVLAVDAPRIVIAAGVIERLPIFSGNRRPGVVGSLEAYDRAARYGIWIGRRTLFSTTTSIAYRLAAQIKGSGVNVERVADTRISPQSRFVEIGKAYGIQQLQGSRPISAQGAAAHSGSGLRVTFGAAAENRIGSVAQDYAVDQFTVSGGWQPELTLWHMAGGTSRWVPARHALMAEGSVDGTMLAGSVTGLETAAACRKSGEAAAAALFGVAAPEITEQQIAAIYETADDATPIAPVDSLTTSTAYLDGGISLATRPGAPRRFRWGRRQANPAGQWQGLGVADIAAAVELDMIASAEAGVIAREHGPSPDYVADAEPLAVPFEPPVDSGSVPAYLVGRFGAAQLVRSLEALDGRRFEIGCLIYAEADDTDPLAAIGVMIGPAQSGQSGGVALLGGSVAAAQTLWVRDISGSSAAREVAEMPLLPVLATAGVADNTNGSQPASV